MVDILAFHTTGNGDPAADAIFVPVREGGVLGVPLVGNGLREECAGVGRVHKVGALAFMPRFEI